jgi:glycosyltransferase involved in cell wall biosynthesis
LFMNKPLKVAIVHDWLTYYAGAERALDAILETYPDADLYALFGNTKNFPESIRKKEVRYSWLNRLPFAKRFKLYRYLYFLFPLAIEQFDFSEYDLVISSSFSVAHGVIVPHGVKHITYMYSPMRYAWDQYHQYFFTGLFSWWKKLVIPIFVNLLRMWDVSAINRSDKIVTISSFVSKRLEQYYSRKPDGVIHPPVDLKGAKVIKDKQDYYLSIAPFEPNKGGELLIKTAIETGINLKIIGRGTLEKRLKRLAKGNKNFEFLGYVDEKEKWKLVSNAKALLMAGIEDFGIVNVEALACGTPVIANAGGGALDTVEDGKTGVLFREDCVEGFKGAIKRFESMRFDVKYMVKFAKKFEKEMFKEEFRGYVYGIISS